MPGGDPTARPFGVTPDGRAVTAYTLRNDRGVEVRFTGYGATILGIAVPDRQGRMDDVTIGYDSLDGYLRERLFAGCIVGRYANRIARGRFTLDGTTPRPRDQRRPNHLHGGQCGFDRGHWNVQPFRDASAVLAPTSPATSESRGSGPRVHGAAGSCSTQGAEGAEVIRPSVPC